MKNLLVLNCTGTNNQLGLKIDKYFFIHNIKDKVHNNDKLVSTIINFVDKHKVKLDENFSILVNRGPGSFSTLRASLAVARGIKISKKVKLYGFKNGDLLQFNLENIEVLIDKNLLEKNLIKPLYLS
tara:strand:+ start:13069 stop:13449 length:381 start_codon:yes stop_codon:yes gene_type:complete